MQLRALRFCLVGILNTAVGLGIIAGGIALGLPPLFANLLGYTVGLCVSFCLNARFTFGRDPRNLRQLVRYFAAFLLAYSCNLMVVIPLDSAYPSSKILTHVAGIPPYTIVFFILADRFVFTDRAHVPSLRNGRPGDA